MTRLPLDNRRRSEPFNIDHGGQTYFVSKGLYADGRVEVLVQARRTASHIEALARDAAILVSLALQHGCAMERLRHAVTREEDGSPSTLVGAVLDALPSTGSTP